MRQQIKFVSSILLLFFLFGVGLSGMTIVQANAPLPFSESFTGFTGIGFAPTPAAGQLDSDFWRVTGLSDGAGSFGGTHTTGDFARGTSTGGVATGGVYAFDVGGGNISLGIQPGGADFTPGTITLRIMNTTGSTITNLDVSYTIWYLNDQARANSLNFAHSADDVTYTSVAALDFTTPEVADVLDWQSTVRSTTLTGLTIANGSTYYLQWQGDDVSGSGNRDEYGIDDVQVSVPVGDTLPVVSSTVPADNAIGVVTTSDLTINFSESVNVTDPWFDINCTISGNHTATVTGTSPTNSYLLNPTTDLVNDDICFVTIYASQVTDVDGTPDNMMANYLWDFQVVSAGFGACGDEATPVHALQGNSFSTPLAGYTGIIIEGIVIGDYQGTTGLSGFYVQEEDADVDGLAATSEGVFVYDNTFGVPVVAGDLVRVQGNPNEAFGQTELNGLTNLTVCSSGNSLPAAATVVMPVASLNEFEQVEGMRVVIPQALTAIEVFNLGRFGEVRLAANGRVYQYTHLNAPNIAGNAAYQTAVISRTIILDDGSNVQNPDPVIYPDPGLSPANPLRDGDSITGLIGVMGYGFGNYRIQPTGSISFTTSNPRAAAPINLGGTVTVASFNVLNYFNGNGLGGGFPTPRGAHSLAEFTRQRNKTIAAIAAMDADVVGLIEIENDATPNSAIEDLVSGLNAATSPGMYAFIDTGVIGTDEIRVAIIYQPGRVTPVGSFATDITGAFAARNRPPLAQTFSVNATSEIFTVVVNHLKSKGSDCDSGTANDPDNVFPDDPDTFDGQGNCNLTRVIAVNQLTSWLATDPTGSGDPDFLVLGDLNAYRLEDPIAAFLGANYTNLLESFIGVNAYSYVFQGQSGYLDHALSSVSLTGQVANAVEWHINSDEAPDFDYNDNICDSGESCPAALNQPSLYSADAYRSADHDPVMVSLYAYDFGDLPMSYGTAWHTEGGALRLGTNWTADRTFGDDTDNSSDDGIERLGSGWVPGATVTLRATVTRVSGSGGGWLSCWMDWDGDGVFAAAAERAINTAVTEGINDINLTIPGSAPGLANLEARCRLYDSATEPFAPLVATPTGAGTGGEVEDYNWSFSPTAITLQEIEVVGAAAAPIILSLVVILLGMGSVWVLRRRMQ